MAIVWDIFRQLDEPFRRKGWRAVRNFYGQSDDWAENVRQGFRGLAAREKAVLERYWRRQHNLWRCT